MAAYNKDSIKVLGTHLNVEDYNRTFEPTGIYPSDCKFTFETTPSPIYDTC